MDLYWKFLQEAAAKSSFRPELSHWIEMWPTFCGPPFDRVSKPRGLKNGTLVVEVESDQWLKNMEKSLNRIEGRIRKMGWGVEKVVLFVPGGVINVDFSRRDSINNKKSG